MQTLKWKSENKIHFQIDIFCLSTFTLVEELHCKFLPHENYRDWELQGPCRENLHYLWKRAVDKPCNIYRLWGIPMIIIGFPRNM